MGLQLKGPETLTFLQLREAEHLKKRPALQSNFSFSTFLNGNFKSRPSDDSLFNSLAQLLEQLTDKVGAESALLAYHKSGIQQTVQVGSTTQKCELTEEEQQQLEAGNPLVRPQTYVHPIENNNNFAGLIYLFKNSDSWKPLSSDLVQAYALLCTQNIRMQQKQDNLRKYADSLLHKKKELEKIQEYNQNLLSITTHDLSSPLTAVSGYLDMIDQCLESDDSKQQIQKYHKQIESGVNDVSDMLKQLSEVIKFKKGFLSLDTVKVDVNWVVNDICEILQANAAKKEINLQTIPADRPIYIEVDIIKFKRIIYNLVSNAIKYTQRKKNINVRIGATDSQVCVQVKDEGIGISEDKLDKIFQPFVKLNETKNETCSQGLGLYISSYFAELMGGEINAQSTSGEGSTFTIHLPRVVVTMPHANTG